MPTESFFNETRIVVGLGTGCLPEGTYQPILLSGYIGIDLKKHFPKLARLSGTLSFILEPQIRTILEPESAVECGLGIGLHYRYPIRDSLSFYLMGSIGPHYLAIETSEQARGFLFTDSLEAGLYYHLTKDSAITLGYRFNHLSNAHLKLPNNGIDSHFAILGYSVFFN